jgi:hypothetical protein
MHWAPPIILLAAVALAVAPFALLGYPQTHSDVLNIAWTGQFVELLRAGEIYPRWLPRAFDGFGSPTFLFYAPLPFYLAAVIDLLSFGLLSREALVSAASATMIAASAVTMRRWLLRHVDPGRAAIGAAIYVLAPYHMLDAYVRGSLGELAAYAILPMLADALERTLRSPQRGWPFIGMWTGLLVLSHLPTTLAVGLVAIPLRIIGVLGSPRASMARKTRFLACACLGAAFGLAISSVYWVPALTLMDIATFYYGESAYYDPQSWLVTNIGAWPDPNLMVLVVFIYLGLGVLAVLGIFALGRRRDGCGVSWSWALLFLCLAMSGAIPFIWGHFSPLHRIQFPWRMVVIGEFLAVTIVMRMSAGVVTSTMARAVAVAAVPLALACGTVLLLTLAAYRDRDTVLPGQRRGIVIAQGPEPAEYLPAGHPVRFSGGGILPDQIFAQMGSYPRSRAAWSEPEGAARVEVWPELAGDMRIEVVATDPARIVLRRFYYPLWRLETGRSASDAPALEPHGPDQLASFAVEPGTHSLRLVWSPPTIVQISAAASSLAALVLAWFGVVAPLRISRRTRRSRA